jgi:hypothetical protein
VSQTEFVYTGDIRIEECEDAEAAETLLQCLLELLMIADLWELPKLKSKIGSLIAQEHMLIGPDTYKMSMSTITVIFVCVLTLRHSSFRGCRSIPRDRTRRFMPCLSHTKFCRSSQSRGRGRRLELTPEPFII